MGRNDRLINSLNAIARRNRANNILAASDELVPHVYAAIAIALHRQCGWGYTRINRLFAESQRLWEDLGSDAMVKLCEQETGISLKTGYAEDYQE